MQYIYRGETFIDIGEDVPVKGNSFVKSEGKTVYILHNVNSREEAEKQKPDNAVVVSWYDTDEYKTIYGYVFDSELPFTKTTEGIILTTEGIIVKQY